MAYTLDIGLRYLRSKKRSAVSMITVVAVIAVGVGVAALLTVMSITSGFQDEFRNKVLGVNAHVLVLKYGLDFDEYRDVMTMSRRMPEVAGAAPFTINEMMLAKGDRISGVLVKGVDPELMPTVLDLPQYMIEGNLQGLRRSGATPAIRPAGIGSRFDDDTDLDRYLASLASGGRPDAGSPDGGMPQGAGSSDAGLPSPDGQGASPGAPALSTSAGVVSVDRLPVVDVPTPEEMERLLAQLEGSALPTDEQEARAFASEPNDRVAEEATDRLPGIVVGVTLARSLDLSLGDRVKVISPLAGLDLSLWSDAPRAPRSRDFRVIGVFEAGFQEYDSRLVYVDLYEAQRFSDQGDAVTGVELRLHDMDRAPEIAARLERQLGAGPFHTMDWEDLNHNLFTALTIQKVALSCAIASIICVAAFCVIATLIMVVLEKKREISILKAMGAKNSSVLSIFLIYGVVIGVVGTVLGVLLGGGVCLYLATYEFALDPKVYLIDHLPVRISAVEFVWTVAIAFVICTTATIIPSWWAARFPPAEGVRYE